MNSTIIILIIVIIVIIVNKGMNDSSTIVAILLSPSKTISSFILFYLILFYFSTISIPSATLMLYNHQMDARRTGFPHIYINYNCCMSKRIEEEYEEIRSGL